MFVQLSSSNNWLWRSPEAVNTVAWLRKTYGAEATHEDVLRPDGSVYMVRSIPNLHWFLDRKRHRIYIKEEKTLTLMLLALS
jgi:hypothetical protein